MAMVRPWSSSACSGVLSSAVVAPTIPVDVISVTVWMFLLRLLDVWLELLVELTAQEPVLPPRTRPHFLVGEEPETGVLAREESSSSVLVMGVWDRLGAERVVVQVPLIPRPPFAPWNLNFSKSLVIMAARSLDLLLAMFPTLVIDTKLVREALAELRGEPSFGLSVWKPLKYLYASLLPRWGSFGFQFMRSPVVFESFPISKGWSIFPDLGGFHSLASSGSEGFHSVGSGSDLPVWWTQSILLSSGRLWNWRWGVREGVEGEVGRESLRRQLFHCEMLSN